MLLCILYTTTLCRFICESTKLMVLLVTKKVGIDKVKQIFFRFLQKTGFTYFIVHWTITIGHFRRTTPILHQSALDLFTDDTGKDNHSPGPVYSLFLVKLSEEWFFLFLNDSKCCVPS